jgi:hypothetical protein
MSHIAEEYAKSLGCKIGSPVLEPHFFPVASKKYITFHTNGKKVPAKHYDFWGIVFLLIKGKLKEAGINIIQTGGPEDPPYRECDQSHLGCSFKQMSYVIKNSELHLGIDSLPMHIASAFNKKIVALFSNLFIENASPLWSSNDDCALFSPDFSKIKPSFASTEPNKRINEVKPEQIASSVLNLLGICHDLDDYKTLRLGVHYPNEILEVIPNFQPQSNYFPNLVANLRCDYGVVEEVLPSWLSRKSNIMTESPIPLQLLSAFRENIAGVTMFMDSGLIDKEYLTSLSRLNMKFNLICKDKSKLQDLRFKFFDWVVEEHVKFSKKDVDFGSELCDNTFYHSNKVLVSEGKNYLSKAAWKAGVEMTNEPQKLIDSEEFWEEIEHLNIYNYAKKEDSKLRNIH